MRLRIRGPLGQSTVALDDTATVQTLKDTIQKETSLASFDVKYGYPPKSLALDTWVPSKLLTEVDVKLNGERESRYICLLESQPFFNPPFPYAQRVFSLQSLPLITGTFRTNRQQV